MIKHVFLMLWAFPIYAGVCKHPLWQRFDSNLRSDSVVTDSLMIAAKIEQYKFREKENEVPSDSYFFTIADNIIAEQRFDSDLFLDTFLRSALHKKWAKLDLGRQKKIFNNEDYTEKMQKYGLEVQKKGFEIFERSESKQEIYKLFANPTDAYKYVSGEEFLDILIDQYYFKQLTRSIAEICIYADPGLKYSAEVEKKFAKLEFENINFITEIVEKSLGLNQNVVIKKDVLDQFFYGLDTVKDLNAILAGYQPHKGANFENIFIYQILKGVSESSKERLVDHIKMVAKNRVEAVLEKSHKELEFFIDHYDQLMQEFQSTSGLSGNSSEEAMPVPHPNKSYEHESELMQRKHGLNKEQLQAIEKDLADPSKLQAKAKQMGLSAEQMDHIISDVEYIQQARERRKFDHLPIQNLKRKDMLETLHRYYSQMRTANSFLRSKGKKKDLFATYHKIKEISLRSAMETGQNPVAEDYVKKELCEMMSLEYPCLVNARTVELKRAREKIVELQMNYALALEERNSSLFEKGFEHNSEANEKTLLHYLTIELSQMLDFLRSGIKFEQTEISNLLGTFRDQCVEFAVELKTFREGGEEMSELLKKRQLMLQSSEVIKGLIENELKICLANTLYSHKSFKESSELVEEIEEYMASLLKFLF